MAKYGYIRVSTETQVTQRQYDAMKHISIDKFYEDKMSGKDIQALPNLKALLEVATEHDTIYIDSVDRLGRDVLGGLQVLELMKVNGVRLSILDAPFKIVDLKDPFIRYMLTMQLAMAEYTRELMLIKQKAGIEVARQSGKYKRPKKIKLKKHDEIMKYINKGFNNSHTAKILGVSRQHVINVIKKDKELKEGA